MEYQPYPCGYALHPRWGGDGKEHGPEAKGTGFRVGIKMAVNSSLPPVGWGWWQILILLSASGVLIIKAGMALSKLQAFPEG